MVEERGVGSLLSRGGWETKTVRKERAGVPISLLRAGP
jgi:hypothetical protein